MAPFNAKFVDLFFLQEDPTKPVFDSMTEIVVRSLSGEARDFYDREFSFFNEVTSISGKLKPYIKKTKPEKKVLIFCCMHVRNLTHLKAKIDEEMTKINVDVGVYLPSNPDGKVVDIDKKSGRPLQSHAKVPFNNWSFHRFGLRVFVGPFHGNIQSQERENRG